VRKFLIVLVTLLALVLSGCASYDVENDQTGVEVDGYHIKKTDKTLVGCHQAGQTGWGGSGNDIFYYPAGQRTYSFTGESSESEADPFPVVTADSQTLHQPGFLKFTLTSECDALFDFHKKVGLKYKAYTLGGLRDLEGDYLSVAIGNALNDAVGVYNWKEYYQSATIRVKTETEMIADIQASVNQSLGSDEWIKINSITLAKPVISEELAKGLESVQTAQLAAQAQQQQNAVNRKKYSSLADCVNGFTDEEGHKFAGLDPDTCRIVFLAEHGDIPFYPIPAGGSVVVNGNGQPAVPAE
jgi:hypothetical protein